MSMRMRCPECDVYFELEAKPSVRFASAIGAVTGAVITRRVRGAGLGALVGWGLAKVMHRGAKCPRCAGTVPAGEPAEAPEA